MNLPETWDSGARPYAIFFSAQRFFCAAEIAALPAALILRFALFAGAFFASTFSLLVAAHLLRCASAIALRPAALIFRRRRRTAGSVFDFADAPRSMARSSVI